MTPTELDGLPSGRRLAAMLAIGAGLTMAVLNGTLTNVALPAIARDLQADAAASIWVVNAFQLIVTVSLLPLASLGDIVGYRRIYIGGLIVFTLASLGCAMADTLLLLTGARVLQGLGAAGIMSVNMALVRFIYPRALVGRGIAITVMVVATNAAAGPTIAAAILAVAKWPALFLVNIPIGLLSIALAVRALPHTPRASHRFDTTSALLSAFALGLLVGGLEGFGHGEHILWVALQLLGAILAAWILVRRQRDRSAPLLPVDLFRNPVFALSIATSLSSFAAQGMGFVALPFYLHDVIHRGQVETGLLMTPWPLAVAIMAPIAGRLIERYSAGLLAGIGMGLLGLGYLLLALLPAQPGDLDIVWRMAVCGLGFGLFQTPNNRALVDSAPRERSGAASGIISTARLLGQTTGAAVVAIAFGFAGAANLLRGTTSALLVGAACALLAAVASLMRLRTK
jgi:MFS transporter, DHA2 family, multidrug resistance protein